MKSLIKFINSFIVGAHMAFVEMGKHKLRSILSMLGVMLGVAALVAMLTLIGGIDVFLKDKMSRWTGSVWIWKSWEDPPEGKIAQSRSPGMHLSDGDYLQDSSDAVLLAYKTVERRDPYVTIGGSKFNWVRLRGTTASTLADDTRDLELGFGRMLSDNEYQEGTKSCLISWDLFTRMADQVGFERQDSAKAIGMEVSFRSIRFRIVGILVPLDRKSESWNFRSTVVIPLKAMQKYITGNDPDPGNLNVSIKDPTMLEALSKKVGISLAQKHRGVTDFEYRGADWADNIKKMLGNISLVMGVISVVSLLVGGLGIMNVMLSSISERIKEIGVRKALGAQNFQIFVQFLAETTTLSVTGGVIGAAIGLLPIVFSDAIEKSSNGAIVPTVLPQHVVFVFFVVVFVGVVFGLYPALKASRMNPIDALRYE